MVAAADQRLAEVDRVGAGSIVGPAGEGVALAGRGQGLAGDAVAVGHALERLVAVEERAAVGDVEDVDGVVLLNGIPLSIKGSVLATADERVIKVDRIGTLAVVGPAGEGVALAGRGQGLAGDAVAVGHALQDFVAISENTAVGDIENVLLVVSKLCPLSEERSMLTATLDGLGEVDRLGTSSIVSPTSKGIALAGRGQRLAGDAVAVSDTLHGLIAIGENAAIGHIENRLLVVLLPLGINSRVAAARNDGLREVDGVISVAIVRPTKEVIALAGRLKRQTCNTVGIGYTLHSFVAIEERAAVGNVEDFDSLVLLHRRPSGEKGHMIAATDDRLVEVDLLGSVAVIIPTGKHIAVARRSKRLTSNAIAVSLTQHDVIAVGELTAIGRVGHIEHIRGSLSPLGEQHEVISTALKGLGKIDSLGKRAVIIPAVKDVSVAHRRIGLINLAVFIRSIIIERAEVGPVVINKSAPVSKEANLLFASGGRSSSPLVCTLGSLRRDSSNRRGAEHHTQAQTGCDSSVKLPIHVVVLSRLASSRPLRRRRHLNCIINSSREIPKKVAQPSYI